MENTGLTSDDINKIRAVFSKHEQIEKVLIYGSRAMGNFRPASDIDLTLIGKDICLTLLHEIEMELDDLMLPYKFDITIFTKITNPEFISHILKAGKEFYKNEI